MKHLNKVGLLVGSISAMAFALSACGDDPVTEDAKGGASGSGTGGAAAGAGGKAAGGSSAGAATGGAATGGTGGAATGGAGGKASGGTGGASGGTGGASGGGGAGGAGGAAASAACTTWCVGAKGVVAQCAGMIAADIDSEAKCLAECKTAVEASLTCWNVHLDNVANKGQPKGTHCPHATGAANNGVCGLLNP